MRNDKLNYDDPLDPELNKQPILSLVDALRLCIPGKPNNAHSLLVDGGDTTQVVWSNNVSDRLHGKNTVVEGRDAVVNGFDYLARHREVLQDPSKVEQYLQALDPLTRAYIETKAFHLIDNRSNGEVAGDIIGFSHNPSIVWSFDEKDERTIEELIHKITPRYKNGEPITHAMNMFIAAHNHFKAKDFNRIWSEVAKNLVEHPAIKDVYMDAGGDNCLTLCFKREGKPVDGFAQYKAQEQT